MNSRLAIQILGLVLALSEASAGIGRQRDEEQTVLQLIERIIPGRQKEFIVIIENDLATNGLDRFEFQTVNDTILQITATTGVAAAWGFNHYLKYFCKAHISWSGNQLSLPKPLPKVTKLTITSPNRYRYYQNVCTSSYSFVWWNWTRWEKEIDWMALNGINLPLAFTGQEEIWRRVYTKLGITMQELEEHFTGPAFLAWGRMGNIRGWGGPLPYPSWFKTQLSLQHRILARMRAFGMKAVLPGFAGHVPAALKRLHPTANIVRLGDWGGFNSTYCCTYFLDPNDSLFQKIGSMFVEEQSREYNGTDHIYNADSFNEMTPPSSDPEYLASSSHSILGAMQLADPEAIWLMQGWLFQDKSFWKPAQIKALLTGVPIGKMIVLDLFADVNPIWIESESFYGQPFIWCMLHNFGGNHGLYGKVESITKGPLEARLYNGSTMIGTGMAPEGIEQNDFIYDLMSEMGWRSEKIDVLAWSGLYAQRRYGLANDDAKRAWKLLASSVYNCTDDHADHNKGIPVMRPTSLKLEYSVWYAPVDLIKAWEFLLSSAEELHQSGTYRYDLVDVGRQVLQDISYTFYKELIDAYEKKDILRCKSSITSLLQLLEDLNELLSSEEHFLLGKWLEAAKAVATNEGEKIMYEFNARNQITMWGPDDNIHDYANKMWSGLTESYYLQRWKLFSNAVLMAVESGQSVDMRMLKASMLKFERSWNSMKDVYPTQPHGDTIKISKMLYERYSKFVSIMSNKLRCCVGKRIPRYSGRSYLFAQRH